MPIGGQHGGEGVDEQFVYGGMGRNRKTRETRRGSHGYLLRPYPEGMAEQDRRAGTHTEGDASCMNVIYLLRFGGIRSLSRRVLSLRKSRGSVHRFTLDGNGRWMGLLVILKRM